MASRACCTTPSALCFWGCMFAGTYGVGLVLAGLWAPLRPFDQTMVFGALAVACFVNAAVNRTLHCMWTAPLFALAAVVVGLSEAGLLGVDVSLVWSVTVVGFGLALLLEWRTTPLEHEDHGLTYASLSWHGPRPLLRHRQNWFRRNGRGVSSQRYHARPGRGAANQERLATCLILAPSCLSTWAVSARSTTVDARRRVPSGSLRWTGGSLPAA